MKSRGTEMRRLTMAVSVSVLLLVLAIVAYFSIDATTTTNRNITNNKRKIIEEAVRSLKETGNAFIITNFSLDYLEFFNQDLIKKLFAGDVSDIYKYAVKVILMFYPVEYVAFVSGGKVVEYGSQSGVDVDPAEMPIPPEDQEYVTLDRLGDRSGFFISVFFPVNSTIPGFEAGSGMRTNMVIDRTEELAAIEDYFNDQRRGFLLRLFIAAGVAVLLSLLLTTAGLRYFTRKYVVDPIEKLNRQAQEIMEGSFEGEVEVDEKSAYAALQSLLRSGQKVLQRMEKELK